MFAVRLFKKVNSTIALQRKKKIKGFHCSKKKKKKFGIIKN